MTVVSSDTVTAMTMDRCRPCTAWAKVSLPVPLVPNQCSGEGGAVRLVKSTSVCV
jgi:hypothetical protein